ncbi:efflux RND transporter periplasmic adaptor subunit [Hymenobacter ginsengisoli]|nr:MULTISPECIES: efflux RND transporter periplasmic adaptor subunit [unclassified Hymenobacter]
MLLAWGATACQPNKREAAHPPEKAGASTYYTCSMHPQVVRTEPGNCPICGMDLIKASRQSNSAPPPAGATPAAAGAHYTCPMHPQINREKPGDCPICGMTLVKVASQTTGTRALGHDARPSAEVKLSAQQLQLANIQVATFGSTSAESNGPVLTGTLTTNANQSRLVSSRVSGRIEQLFVRQTGESVRQGAPLVSIYSEELQALQQDYLLSLAQQRLGGPDVNQYGRLVEGARQRLRLLGMSAGQLRTLAATGRPTPSLTFYSPQTGLVQTVGVTEGQYVSEGTPLVLLTNLASLWVEAQLYPEEVAGIHLGQAVRVQVAGFAASFSGKVIFLSPELEANSRVTLLRVQLANPTGSLQPGMQANVRLAAPGAAAQTQRLPQAAVLHDSRGSYVWQQVATGRFRRLTVTTGPENDQTVAITAGLPAGAQVVVSGAYLLESEYALYPGDAAAGGSAPPSGTAGQAAAMDPTRKM